MPVTQNITNGWEFVFTASNTTSIPVANIPTSVNNLLIVYTRLMLSTTTIYPIIQVSTGSGYISSGYQSGVYYSSYNASAVNSNQTLTTGFQVGIGLVSLTTYASGSICLYNLNTSNNPMVTGNSVFYDGTNTYTVTGGGNLPGTTGANSFQITVTSGNIVSGNFKIYALN